MLKRADKAEKRLETVEKDMLDVARRMGKSETTREATAKREEALKIKFGQQRKQLVEAESRAHHMEEEQHKLELLIEQMKEEKEILCKMRAKKSKDQT